MLPNEEERDDLEAVLRESSAASKPPDEFVEQLHERLQNELAGSRKPQVRPLAGVGQDREAKNPWKRTNYWVGGLTMRQRIAALSGVSVAALLGLFLFWGAIDTRPVSAMDRMAESVVRAKSCKITAITRTTLFFKLDDAAKPIGKKRETKAITYWQAPDKARTEHVSPGMSHANIIPGEGKPWLSISHETETFHLHPATDEDRQSAFTPDMFTTFADRADRDLGIKEINGKTAWGFAISDAKIDPKITPPGQWEIWVDQKTNLPISLRSETKSDTMTSVMETTEIQWNIDLDPELFDATPPDGYWDLTWKAPTSGEPVRLIVEALRRWAQMTQDEHYPMKERLRVKDVETSLRSIDVILADPDRSGDQGNEDFLGTLRELREGLLHLRAIAGQDRDVAYYGETVGPDDKDEVLLRWKLDDGRYQVIFGDLHDEVVTAERLGVLERK